MLSLYVSLTKHDVMHGTEILCFIKILSQKQETIRITYLFTTADIFLLYTFYHNIFCFFTTDRDLMADAIFDFETGQKRYCRDISFLCQSVYYPFKGAST